MYRVAGRVVLESGEVDSLLALYVTPEVTRPADIERAVVDLAAEADTTPVVACMLGLEARAAPLRVERRSTYVPTVAFPESAAAALAHAAGLAEWRRRPRGTVADPAVNTAHAAARIADELAVRPAGGWLGFEVASGILADYGVPVAGAALADSAVAAAAAADTLGYPVALKAAASELLHKTDVGGVALALGDAGAVRAAFERMQRDLGDALGGVLVQPMAEPGVELITGITRDPQFGAILVFGMGGFSAELQRDTTLRLPPLSDVDIDEMLHALRGSPLLFGYRNSPGVDVPALADVLARIGRLAVDLPEIAELDCNPVVASPAGALVLDVKLRVAPAPTAVLPGGTP